MIISATSNSNETSGLMSSKDVPASGSTAESSNNNVVVSQASIDLPFSTRLAYFTFSDFTRHVEWNPHVTKVEYTDASNSEARWTMESYGLQFGWSTIPMRKEPTKLLTWKSVKGIQLECRAEFEPTGENHCRMLYTQSYVLPRKIMKQDLPVGPSKRESSQLKLILTLFREAVQKDIESYHASGVF